MFHFVHKLAPVPIPTLVVTRPFLGWVRPNARLVDIVSWIGRVDQAWSGRGKEGGVVSSVVVVLPVNAGKLPCMQTRLYIQLYIQLYIMHMRICTAKTCTCTLGYLLHCPVVADNFLQFLCCAIIIWSGKY